MSSAIHVDQVRLSPGSQRDESNGLLGYVACVVNGVLRLDGIVPYELKRVVINLHIHVLIAQALPVARTFGTYSIEGMAHLIAANDNGPFDILSTEQSTI